MVKIVQEEVGQRRRESYRLATSTHKLHFHPSLLAHIKCKTVKVLIFLIFLFPFYINLSLSPILYSSLFSSSINLSFSLCYVSLFSSPLYVFSPLLIYTFPSHICIFSPFIYIFLFPFYINLSWSSLLNSFPFSSSIYLSHL